MPVLSEDSEEAHRDASSTEKQEPPRLSAGTSERESSRDSSATEEDALSSDKLTDFSLDALEPRSEDTDGADSTSEVLRSSEDSQDKDNTA